MACVEIFKLQEWRGRANQLDRQMMSREVIAHFVCFRHLYDNRNDTRHTQTGHAAAEAEAGKILKLILINLKIKI